MWCAAGYPPGTFWRQTERSFANAVAGAAEREIALAWQIEFFARQKSLNRLSEYLRPSHGQAGSEHVLLNSLLKLQAQGVPMKVERLH